MGMSASQYNILMWTSRKSDINRELQSLSLSEEALTREMQGVTRDYQAALSRKTMKWSSNSGLTYSDISYSTLMTPNLVNGNSPVLLCDTSGRVLVNSHYLEYAKKISPNGAAGGDYESVRDEILKELVTGYDDTKAKAFSDADTDLKAKKKAYEDAVKARNAIGNPLALDGSILKNILANAGLESLKLSETSKAGSNLSKIKSTLTGGNYFPDDVKSKINALNVSDLGLNTEDTKTYSSSEFIESCVLPFITSASTSENKSCGGSTIYLKSDRKTGCYSEWKAADNTVQTALADYNAAKGVQEGVFDGEQDKLIEFYDQLFNAIASQGWVNDSGVEDSEYLTQMLQNNSYCILNMTKKSSNSSDESIEYLFDMDIALNSPNIFSVNDSEGSAEALAEYEYKKSIINEKESKINTRMKDLETEEQAITKMIESAEKVENENIERTFGIWA